MGAPLAPLQRAAVYSVTQVLAPVSESAPEPAHSEPPRAPLEAPVQQEDSSEVPLPNLQADYSVSTHYAVCNFTRYYY